MPVARARGAKARADKLFSLIVRSRHYCQRCGEDRYEKLQTAHIISRRYANTRCNFNNAFCLCIACHRFFNDHPYDFGRFCQSQRGAVILNRLYEAAHSKRKVDWDIVANELDDMWKAMSA